MSRKDTFKLIKLKLRLKLKETMLLLVGALMVGLMVGGAIAVTASP